MAGDLETAFALSEQSESERSARTPPEQQARRIIQSHRADLVLPSLLRARTAHASSLLFRFGLCALRAARAAVLKCEPDNKIIQEYQPVLQAKMKLGKQPAALHRRAPVAPIVLSTSHEPLLTPDYLARLSARWPPGGTDDEEEEDTSSSESDSDSGGDGDEESKEESKEAEAGSSSGSESSDEADEEEEEEEGEGGGGGGVQDLTDAEVPGDAPVEPSPAFVLTSAPIERPFEVANKAEPKDSSGGGATRAAAAPQEKK